MHHIAAAEAAHSNSSYSGKGRGDASGQGNECLRVCFYLKARCDVGVSSGILSVI